MRLRPVTALRDNYVWILADAAGGALVVDPGEADPVLRCAAQDGLRPHTVLLTHHHPDHVGGVAALLEQWPDLHVIAPADERITTATEIVGEGDNIHTGPWRFKVMEIPGHTRSHVAFHGEDLLFCGDTLFSLGCGRMFEGTPMQMLTSLDRLAALPGQTRVCCGHEYTVQNAAFASVVDPDNPDLAARTAQAHAQRAAGESTLPSLLSEELAANPFLRVDAPAIRHALMQRTGHALPDRVDAFAELRRWKDGFAA